MNKISRVQFAKTFNHRHTFSSGDIQVLKSKFPNIEFKNVPDAWICQIDYALAKISSSITFIGQVMGFLDIDCRNISELDFKIIKELERKLYSIDIDLHERLSESN